MKNILIVGLFLIGSSGLLQGQGKYLTSEGYIRFYSHTALEDITAENHNVASVIDVFSGELLVIVKMTEFRFKKKLMQEHFNENYVESEKYPKATFSGKILNSAELDFSVEGVYEVRVEGEMTIHGISNEVKADGSIEVISGSIIARSTFMLNPEDYDIQIPRVVRKNISENLELTLELKHQAL